MLREHIIRLPRMVVVGQGIIDNIPAYLKDLQVKEPILIVTGPHVFNIVANRVLELIKDYYTNIKYVIVEKASIDEASKVLEKISSLRPQTVIGIGGGKSIDIAKYVSSKINARFISMPTSASHDGIASPFASLKGSGRATSFRAVVPDAIIADVELISKAPKRLLRAGVGDIVAKFTAVADWRLSHKLRGEYYGEYAASLALLSAKHIVSFIDEISRFSTEGVRILVEALVSSGIAMCIAGSTRPASGSEHLFSHALDMVAPKPALHGEQVGVGTIMMSYLHGMKWSRIKRVLKRVGAPTTARELGIPDKYIIEALLIAPRIRPERYTILGEKGLTREAAIELAKITGVIE